jgi:hypothetical protein
VAFLLACAGLTSTMLSRMRDQGDPFIPQMTWRRNTFNG